MKIRSGFVANSSSSSFIVIKEGKKQKIDSYLNSSNGETLVIPQEYSVIEFGWKPKDIKDVYSKINFAYMQSLYADRRDWKHMLEAVIRNEYPEIKRIKWFLTVEDFDSKYNGYIDHSSNASEGENIEIFNSIESLTTFITSENSYIHCDNDNY